LSAELQLKVQTGLDAFGEFSKQFSAAKSPLVGSESPTRGSTVKSISVSCLAVLAASLMLASNVPAAECTPVVYAFRHAEDFDKRQPERPCLPGSPVQCTTALTPVGMAHANLYLQMISNLETEENFCGLAAVYAVNPILPNGNGGTTNPYLTGAPLSNELFELNPYIDVLDESIDQNRKNFDQEALFAALVAIAKANGSVAFFWTSEGLHDLGVFLGTQIIPKKGGPTPPRNAAYIFRFDGNSAFLPPSKTDEFVQCFNYAKGGKAKNNFTNRFYCGKGPNGNLDVPDDDLDKLQGMICAPAASDFTKVTSPPDYYGYCQSQPTGAE
jgi:hypothetical protein